MINSFKNYLVEEEKTLYIVWGRMNPPTAGHEKLLDFLKSKAGNNPFRIYLTQSEDDKKNPIPFVQKVKFARKGFPQYARQIMMDKKLKTIFDAMVSFYNEGFKRVVIVAGSDRVREYDITLNKYNGQKARHGFYNFERISVLNAGNRDPESKGVEGVSGTKLRGYAETGDFTKFAQYMPKKLSNSEAKQVYNAVRQGLGLKEQKEFKNHVQLKPVSQIRESYVDGKLFDIGDTVVIKETGEVASVKHLGTNYVIVEKSGNQYRKWLDAVEQVEQPRVEYEVFNEKLNENIYYDVADFSVSKDSIIISNEDVSEASMQKFKNFEAADTHKTKDGRTAKKGLWYNIHQKRKRGEKPAKPGDKDYPKTLDIEQTMDQTRAAISREKEVEGRRDAADKKRHDSMLDRARSLRTRMVNRTTK